MGDAFEVRSWTLGPRYKWINAIAVVFVAVMFVVLMLPTNTFGVPWEDDFDWSFFNYTPVVVGLVLLGTWLAWVLGANNATRARFARSSSTRAWASSRRSRPKVRGPRAAARRRHGRRRRTPPPAG